MSSPNQEPVERSALARRLLPGGREPDARFTLANERTFLAWIRTSLALLGGGVALEAFGGQVFHPSLRKGSALMLVVVGLVMAGSAIFRWIRVEQSMRHSRPLPVPSMVPLLGIGVGLAAGVLLFLIATGR